jgi:hypothetical protein
MIMADNGVVKSPREREVSQEALVEMSLNWALVIRLAQGDWLTS